MPQLSPICLIQAVVDTVSPVAQKDLILGQGDAAVADNTSGYFKGRGPAIGAIFFIEAVDLALRSNDEDPAQVVGRR